MTSSPVVARIEDFEVGTIAAEDLKLLLFTDSVDEAMAHIQKHAIEQFGLVRTKAPLRSRFLGE